MDVNDRGFCEFCIEFSHKGNSRRIIMETENFTVVPSVGSLTIPHLLVVPRMHTLSFAALSPDLACEAFTLCEKVRQFLAGSCDANIIVAEHGAGLRLDDDLNLCSELGASCLDHAHLHLISVPDAAGVLADYEAVGGPASIVGPPEHVLQVIGTNPYISLSVSPGAWSLWPATERFGRQFIRRVVAGRLGSTDWNWRTHPHPERLAATMRMFQGHILPIGPCAGIRS